MTIQFKSKSGERHLVDFCERNLNILAHAQSIELDIGSQCGGHGVCGGDRIKVKLEDSKHFSPLTEEERHHFTEEQLAQGWRLGCQCFPEESDLSLKVEIP